MKYSLEVGLTLSFIVHKRLEHWGIKGKAGLLPNAAADVFTREASGGRVH